MTEEWPKNLVWFHLLLFLKNVSFTRNKLVLSAPIAIIDKIMRSFSPASAFLHLWPHQCITYLFQCVVLSRAEVSVTAVQSTIEKRGSLATICTFIHTIRHELSTSTTVEQVCKYCHIFAQLSSLALSFDCMAQWTSVRLLMEL